MMFISYNTVDGVVADFTYCDKFDSAVLYFYENNYCSTVTTYSKTPLFRKIVDRGTDSFVYGKQIEFDIANNITIILSALSCCDIVLQHIQQVVKGDTVIDEFLLRCFGVEICH